MNSFRFYLKVPTITPSRFVSDYSETERLRLIQTFKPLATRHRRRVAISIGVAAVSISIFLIGGAIFPTPPIWAKAALIPFWIAFVTAAFLLRIPDCPGCGNHLDNGFGPFCPECGSKSLKPGGWFTSPECSSCGRSMRRGKSRGYSIRACTHCGVFLDEKGL